MDVLSYLLVFAAIFEVSLAARIQISCPPIKLKFGRARKGQRGRFVTFFCNTGYTLAGERHAACVQGKWDAVLPKCVRPTCPMRSPPSNGLIFPSHGGGVLNIYCKPSYQARGSTITYCDGRRWDTALPSCLKTNTTPPLSCDFETEDICGWNHDVNHDFDWKRLNFNTPTGTIGTGPSHDHTKGEKSDGYYMYIESSYRSENDTARLISPIYDKTTTNTCFEFFYHMYGATIGTLRVYLKKTNQEWYFNPESAIFSKSGNQGDRWYRGFLNLGVINENYQIIVEGVRGASYVSDMAIDDVKIVENCIYEEEATTTDSSLPTEQPVTVESCLNRCNNSTQITDIFAITCDCDEACYEKNRCCPDYFEYCVQGSSSDDFVDETSPSDVTVMETETATLKLVPNKPIAAPLPAITLRPLSTKKLDPVTSSKRLESTTKALYPTPSPPVTFPKLKITTSLPTKPAKITLPPFKQPELLTPSPTVNVFKKTKNPLRKMTESKIKYVQPEKDQNDLSNDIVEVFGSTLFEVITPNGPIEETGPNSYRTYTISKLQYSEDSNRQKIVIENHQKDHTRTVIFAIGVISGVLLGLVAMAFVVKRYRLYDWNRVRGLRSSSYGDSQSDVRFLNGEEAIDFTLPRNYDSL